MAGSFKDFAKAGSPREETISPFNRDQNAQVTPVLYRQNVAFVREVDPVTGEVIEEWRPAGNGNAAFNQHGAERRQLDQLAEYQSNQMINTSLKPLDTTQVEVTDLGFGMNDVVENNRADESRAEITRTAGWHQTAVNKQVVSFYRHKNGQEYFLKKDLMNPQEVINCPAKPHHKQMYPREYRCFKQNEPTTGYVSNSQRAAKNGDF